MRHGTPRDNGVGIVTMPTARRKYFVRDARKIAMIENHYAVRFVAPGTAVPGLCEVRDFGAMNAGRPPLPGERLTATYAPLPKTQNGGRGQTSPRDAARESVATPAAETP